MPLRKWKSKKVYVDNNREYDPIIIEIENRKTDEETKKYLNDLVDALNKKKKIVAVKTSSTNTTPDNLYGVDTSWAMSFAEDSIKKAVNDV